MKNFNIKILIIVLLVVVFSLVITGCGIKPVMVEITITWNDHGEVKEKDNEEWIEIKDQTRFVQPEISLYLKAFPEEGYEFSHWEITDADYGVASELYKEEIRVRNFKDKARIEAVFIEELERYEITFREENGLKGVKIQVYKDEQRTIPEGPQFETGSNGEKVVELPDGEYWFTASLPNYYDFLGDFVIQEGAKVIDFAMQEGTVEKITVIRQPRLSYSPNDQLDLRELMVEIKWMDGSSQDVFFEDFAEFGLTTDRDHEEVLGSVDDGAIITITHVQSGKTAETGELRVRNMVIIFEEYFSLKTNDDGKEEEKFENRYPGWARKGTEDGLNWNVTDSLYDYSYSGGKPPELSFYFSPEAEGTFIVMTPEIDATGYVDLELIFKQKVTPWDVNDLNFELRVAVSTDSGNTWDREWVVPNDIFLPLVMTISLGTEFDGENIRIAWIYEGDSKKVSGWFIDDIILEGNKN